jgi:hypothetical protein
VTAQRERALPNRSAKERDVGGGDRPLTNNELSPDQAGNLAAMAAAAGFQLVPGLNGAPDMYSVLGLSGDQNNLTFNGLGSGISALPPDVLATTSINAYPFDVSKGGFSGAQITIQTIPGSNFSRRSITNANIAPQLEWATRRRPRRVRSTRTCAWAETPLARSRSIRCSTTRPTMSAAESRTHNRLSVRHHSG